MMDFLTIIGFLGLLGLVVLILIYILKPNYQKKSISSTFVWKLSLKYRRKRIPINKLRNLLIIICQIMIITASTFILAQPFIVDGLEVYDLETIIIIDASASMRAVQDNGRTRFENAVERVKTTGREALTHDGGIVSVILASGEADFIRTETGDRLFRSVSLEDLENALDGLLYITDEFYQRQPNLAVSFGAADIDGAIILADEILEINPNANVILYTATRFADTNSHEYVVNGITIRDVSDNEWNAAILDVDTIFHDGFYSFIVEVASFNRDMNLRVRFRAVGVNEEFLSVETYREVFVSDNASAVIIFDTFSELPRLIIDENNNPVIVDGHISFFERVQVTLMLDQRDSFMYDNEFFIYGGRKEMIRVLYVSTWPENHPIPALRNTAAHNVFFNGALSAVRRVFNDRWNIEFYHAHDPDEVELYGFDLYIFEHVMPSTIPEDGIVMLVNPDRLPTNVEGVIFAEWVYDPARQGIEQDWILSRGEFSPIILDLSLEENTVSRYKRMILTNDNFTPVMFVDGIYGDPVFLIKEESNNKVMIMGFSVHYSSIAMEVDFIFLMHNIFNHFFPQTFDKYIYNVGEAVRLNAIADRLQIIGAGGQIKYFDELPYSFYPDRPGIYTLIQYPFGRQIIQNFFVRVPRQESEFHRIGALRALNIPQRTAMNWDLVIFFAASLVALLLIERLLHIKGEQF